MSNAKRRSWRWSRRRTKIGRQAKLEESKQNGTMLEMVVTMLGVAVCACAFKVLVGGGIVTHLETKDCGFVTLFSFLAFSRCWCYWWPPAHRSFTETTQSLLACYFSRPYNKILFYGSKLLFAMFSVVLAVMRLASQDFGKNEGANMESRDFVLNVFYGLTLAEALLFLFALILSLFPKKRKSVGLADVPKVDPEDDPSKGLRDDCRNGPENVSGGGHEDRPVGEHKDGPEVDLEKGQGGVPGNGSVGRPANQSNDFNSEGLADSLPKLRQRRREIPKSGDGEDGSDEDGPGGEPGNGSVGRPANQSNDFNSEGHADSLPTLEGPADSISVLQMKGVQMRGGQMHSGGQRTNAKFNITQSAGGRMKGVQMRGGQNEVQINGGQMTNGTLNFTQSSGGQLNITQIHSEELAGSLPNLRQRRTEIPKSGDGDSPSLSRDMWRVTERRDAY